MNLKRCGNGHFYNEDKFQSCPHCAAIGGDANITVSYSDLGGGYNTVMTESVTTAMSYYDMKPASPLTPPSNPIPAQPGDNEKTIGVYRTRIDPVAGWLVCIDGEDFGDSFKIKAGKNFVGRDANMDIVLHGDNRISRERHAAILYEPKRREFIAQAGESRELFYLNDEAVLNPVRIKKYDILTIGNTRLMFFPCCDEKFNWDDYKRDEG